MKLSLLTIACAFALNCYSQNQTIQWQNMIAGEEIEHPGSIIQSAAGDYYSVGATSSTLGDLIPYQGGGWDAWLTKTDANGNFIWKKNMGGSGIDMLEDVIQTNDGNFIAVGTSYSLDGDLTGVSFGNTKSGWLFKFDASGTILWQKKIGGSAYESSPQIKESSNGELHIFASSGSNNLDVQTHYGAVSTKDIVYFRLSATGTLLDQRTYGGTEDDELTGVTATNDGGFVILSSSYSNDHDCTQHLGSTADKNVWIFKIDVNKNIAWEKSFLMDGYGYTYKVRELSNGNLIFSYLDHFFLSGGYTDGVLITLNGQGNLVWQKSIGGAKYDEINDIIEMSPNHIMILGSTNSNDSIVTSNPLSINPVWILEIDSLGAINSQKTYGGTGGETAVNFFKTNDNGLVISATTRSHDLDVINSNYWNCMCTDVWLFKLNSTATGIQETQQANNFSLYPNPATDVIHINAATTIQNESYTLINALGQTVLSGKLEGQDNTIDIQQLTPGFYSLQVGKQKQAYKIIKN